MVDYLLDVGKLVGTRGHYMQIINVVLANERLAWRRRAIVKTSNCLGGAPFIKT